MEEVLRQVENELASSVVAGRLAFRSLQSQVLNKLGLQIVSGEFAPESLLPVDSELLIRFDVSRTILREAMQALAAKNLVEARARVGTKVLPRRRWNMFDPDVLRWHFEAGPNEEFFRNLAEIRSSIEPESAALAAERRSDAQIIALFRCVDGMEVARQQEAFAKHDLSFHKIVAEASANPFMSAITALVDVALASAFGISSPVDDPAAQIVTVGNHRRIAQAIQDRNPQAAREAMRTVIQVGYDRSLGKMSKAKQLQKT
ncbi:MAG: FadR/GntR family transcriptional regulator [Mesorhizobium sp.]